MGCNPEGVVVSLSFEDDVRSSSPSVRSVLDGIVCGCSVWTLRGDGFDVGVAEGQSGGDWHWKSGVIEEQTDEGPRCCDWKVSEVEYKSGGRRWK